MRDHSRLGPVFPLLWKTLMNELITREQFALLLLNGEAQKADPDNFNPKPIVKLSNPIGCGTWLLASVDPDDPDIAYGLCHYDMKCPELGIVSIEGLHIYNGSSKPPIERDPHWKADKTLAEYASEAITKRHIAT